MSAWLTMTRRPGVDVAGAQAAALVRGRDLERRRPGEGEAERLERERQLGRQEDVSGSPACRGAVESWATKSPAGATPTLQPAGEPEREAQGQGRGVRSAGELESRLELHAAGVDRLGVIHHQRPASLGGEPEPLASPDSSIGAGFPGAGPVWQNSGGEAVV